MTAFIKRDLMWTNYLLIDQVKCKSIYIHIERYSIRKFHYLFTILLKSRSFVVTYSYAKKCLTDIKENILKKNVSNKRTVLWKNHKLQLCNIYVYKVWHKQILMLAPNVSFFLRIDKLISIIIFFKYIYHSLIPLNVKYIM